MSPIIISKKLISMQVRVFIRRNNQKKNHDAPKKSRFVDNEIGELRVKRKGLQRWRGSGGNVRLSHLLMKFLCGGRDSQITKL